MQLIITAAGVLFFSANLAWWIVTPPVQQQPAPPNPFPAYTDIDHKCRYVIGDLNAEGLHIVVTGESHCRDRIFIDGVRIMPERKV